MATIAGKTVPEIRAMKEENLKRITEIDYQVLGERIPDYWGSKVEMAKEISFAISRGRNGWQGCRLHPR